MKFKVAAVATVIYIVVLLATYTLHARFLTVNVVLYSAVLDAIIAAGITAGLLFWWRYFNPLGPFEKFQLVMIWLLGGYAFAISVPAVIDRSLSLYVLEKLQQRGGGIELAQFESVIRDEYLPEHRVTDIRLTEQRQSGTVVFDNGCVRLTAWGNFLATFSRTFRATLLPRNRLVGDEYTDDLVDPFERSKPRDDYRC